MERFEEEVEREGDEAVQLGVSFELDMERYVGEGRWCYLPRLAVSTVARAGFPFMQGDAFVEYAAYWYAELLDGVTSCEEQLNEGHNPEGTRSVGVCGGSVRIRISLPSRRCVGTVVSITTCIRFRGV